MTWNTNPAWLYIPWDEVDSPTGCAGRKEFQWEPVISGFYPPSHFVPQPVWMVCVQHWSGTPGALLGCLPAAVAGPAGVTFAWLPATVPSWNLVHHVGQLHYKSKIQKCIVLSLFHTVIAGNWQQSCFRNCPSIAGFALFTLPNLSQVLSLHSHTLQHVISGCEV